MIYAKDPNALLTELDQINQAIYTSQAFLNTLVSSRDSILETIDAITRPPVNVTVPATRTIRRGFEYRNTYYHSWCYIAIHTGVLKKLWQDFPEKREEMAAAVRKVGYNRSYISKERARLFDGKPEWWIQKYSVELVDGWYVDTNINLERIRRILPVAVKAAGLAWNSDVRVYWQATTVPVAA